MSTDKDGGPAFPVWELNGQGQQEMTSFGMSMRDYFAAQALPGLMGRAWCVDGKTGEQIINEWAASAYACADAMLRARAG